MQKRLLLIFLLFVVIGCVTPEVQPKEEIPQEDPVEVEPEIPQVVTEPEQEVIEEPVMPKVVEEEPEPEPTANLEGTWTGDYTETQTASICTLENTGTTTLTFNMDGDTFTGTLEYKGRSKVLTGDSDCGGSYITKGTTSGTVTGNKVSATTVIKSSKIDLTIPWTATVVDGVMTSEYTGEGVEEGYDFTLEGTFSVTRTS